MGIVNVTPDSFYEKARTEKIDQAIARAIALEKQGADIIDIGGESTRPGSESVSCEEELERVIPVLQGVQGIIQKPISIDTSKPEVAEKAIRYGASMINDVTGFSNERMRKLAAETKAHCCIMHMQKNPKTMQQTPSYPGGVVLEVYDWLDKQTKLCLHDGIEAQNIIIDPGIGFGKTMQDNFTLIHQAKTFMKLGFHVLYGVSRKTFLRKFLQKETDDVLAGTLAANAFLIISGVHIIRVHDVIEHRDMVDVLTQIAS
jgi:dihydropteroate synthase